MRKLHLVLLAMFLFLMAPLSCSAQSVPDETPVGDEYTDSTTAMPGQNSSGALPPGDKALNSEPDLQDPISDDTRVDSDLSRQSHVVVTESSDLSNSKNAGVIVNQGCPTVVGYDRSMISIICVFLVLILCCVYMFIKLSGLGRIISEVRSEMESGRKTVSDRLESFRGEMSASKVMADDRNTAISAQIVSFKDEFLKMREDLVASGKTLAEDFSREQKKSSEIKEQLKESVETRLKAFGRDISQLRNYIIEQKWSDAVEVFKCRESELNSVFQKLGEAGGLLVSLMRVQEPPDADYFPSLKAESLRLVDKITTGAETQPLLEVINFHKKMLPNRAIYGRIEKEMKACEASMSFEDLLKVIRSFEAGISGLDQPQDITLTDEIKKAARSLRKSFLLAATQEYRSLFSKNADRLKSLEDLLKVLEIEVFPVRRGNLVSFSEHNVQGKEMLDPGLPDDAIVNLHGMGYKDLLTGEIVKAQVIVNKRN